MNIPEKMTIALRRLVFDLQSGLVSRLEAQIYFFEKNIFKTRALLRRFVLSISSPKNHALIPRGTLISDLK